MIKIEIIDGLTERDIHITYHINQNYQDALQIMLNRQVVCVRTAAQLKTEGLTIHSAGPNAATIATLSGEQLWPPVESILIGENDQPQDH